MERVCDERDRHGLASAIALLSVVALCLSCASGKKGIPVDPGPSADISSLNDVVWFPQPDNGPASDAADTIDDAVMDAGWKPSAGPGLIYDPSAISDVASLALAWNQAESGAETSNIGDAYRLVFEFTSQDFLGTPWRHKAYLYVPDGLILQPGHSLAIVQQGTLPSEGDGSATFRKQYGIETAVTFDLPVLIVDGIPPADVVIPGAGIDASELSTCFDVALSEDEFVRCGFGLVHQTKDLAYSPFLPVGRVFLRAVVAAEAMVAQVQAVRPELQLAELAPEHLIFGGEGLAGMGAKMALVSDEHASAAMAIGAELADMDNLAALMAAVWTEGGEWMTVNDLTESMASAWGQTHADTYDIMRFSEVLLGKRLAIGVGTNDPRFPLGATDMYSKFLPAEQMQLFVDNGEKGMDDARYQGLWRSLLDRVLNGVPAPKTVVTTKEENGFLRLQATVVGCKAVEETCFDVRGYVVNYHMDLVDHDYRDAVWVEVPMTRDPLVDGGAGWYGLVDPSSLANNNSFFVQVTDMVDTQLRYTSSGLTFIGEPYPYPSGGSN